MLLQIFKESHILDANNNIQIANPTYMLLNIFTFSSPEKTPQYKKNIIGHFQHPRIHCTGRVKYGSTRKMTAQRRPLALKFSTIFLLEFATKSVNERDRNTHKQREICVCHFLIEQSQHRRIFCCKLNALDVLVEFPTKSTSNPSSLGISMINNIYHCLAAIYSRHFHFSFSTFCI